MSARSGYQVKRRKSRSLRSGLLFPVGAVHNSCKFKWRCFRITKLSPIYLTAVLEYLVAEMMEQAGLLAKLLGEKRISPKYIRLAVRNDEELSKLLPGTVFSGSGGGNLNIGSNNRRQLSGDFSIPETDFTTDTLSQNHVKEKSSKSKKSKKPTVVDEDDDNDRSLPVVDEDFITKEPVKKISSKSSKRKRNPYDVIELFGDSNLPVVDNASKRPVKMKSSKSNKRNISNVVVEIDEDIEIPPANDDDADSKNHNMKKSKPNKKVLKLNEVIVIDEDSDVVLDDTDDDFVTDTHDKKKSPTTQERQKPSEVIDVDNDQDEVIEIDDESEDDVKPFKEPFKQKMQRKIRDYFNDANNNKETKFQFFP